LTTRLADVYGQYHAVIREVPALKGKLAAVFNWLVERGDELDIVVCPKEEESWLRALKRAREILGESNARVRAHASQGRSITGADGADGATCIDGH
jgi:hypothetical protein